jgi:hypothetical protein
VLELGNKIIPDHVGPINFSIGGFEYGLERAESKLVIWGA